MSEIVPADLPSLALCALATWRVASLLVWEDGPWRVFERIRELVGIDREFSVTSQEYITQTNGVFAELWSCVWCMSFWVGAAVIALWWALPEAVAALAIWGGAVLIERWVDGRR